MSSEVEICNLALSHLGSYTITALTDASQEARKCKLYYPIARDFVLRDFPWNFAERRIYLALLSGVDPVGYEYAYQYPVGCLKAREIYNEIIGGEPVDFTINAVEDLSDKMLLTNEANALLIYTAGITDPNVFDIAFINALSFKLASDLAQSLTKKTKLQDTMMKAYGYYMSLAKTANASEAKETNVVDNPLVAARG